MKIPRWGRNILLTIGAFALVVMSFFLLAIAILPSPEKLFSKLPQKSNAPLILPADRKKPEAPIVSLDPSTVSADSSIAETAPVEIETLTDEQVQRRLIDDLVAIDRPVSNFCRSLDRPNSAKIARSEFSQLAKVSVITENEDPRVQSMKPFLRTLLRLPEMRRLVEMAENAALSKEYSLMQTAEFYTQVAKAYAELKSNNSEISGVLDRSYLFHGLNKLLTKRPDLIGHEKIKNFCDLIEEDFNQLRPVEYTQEKRQFVNLLEQFGLSPKDIDFNIDYRSDLSFGLNETGLRMNGGWVTDLFIDPNPQTLGKKSGP